MRGGLRLLIFFCVVPTLRFEAQAQPELRIDSVTLQWPDVFIRFTVNCNGKRIYGIDAANIAISENGVTAPNFSLVCPDSVEPCPVSAALVFDASGSMAGAALRSAQIAGKTFVSMLDGLQDEACIISFDKSVLLRQAMTGDKRDLYAAIDGITTGGATALWDGAFTGIEHAAIHGRNQCRVVVLLADGADNASVRNAEDAISLAVASRIRVFCIGLGAEVDSAALPELARRSGGAFLRADDPHELEQLFAVMARRARREPDGCSIRYAGACTDGGPRTASLLIRDICGGAAMQSATFNAPPGEGAYRPLLFRLAGDSVSAGSEFLLKLIIADTLREERFPVAELDLRFDDRVLQFLNAEQHGNLMAPLISADHPSAPGRLRLRFGTGAHITGTGTLLALRFRAREVANTVCSELTDVSLRFEDGCLLPAFEQSRICVLPCGGSANLAPFGPVAVCPGDTLLLVTDANCAAYEWTRNGMRLAENGSVLRVDSGGAYRVRTIDKYGCIRESATALVSFPSPTSLAIRADPTATTAREGSEVEVPLRITPPIAPDRPVRLDISIGYDPEILELRRFNESETTSWSGGSDMRISEGRIVLSCMGAPAMPTSVACAPVFAVKNRDGKSGAVTLRISADVAGGCVSSVVVSDADVMIDGYCEPALSRSLEASLRVAPNPARDQAVAICSIPESGHARLALYDAHGRLTEVLFDGIMREGQHSIQLNLRRKAAGAYLVLLSSNDRFTSAPLLLLK